MKRVYLLITLVTLLFITGQSIAQDQPVQSPRTFTLQQCIDYALENATLAKNVRLDEKIAESKVRETIGIGLPQISGSASMVHNEKLPRFFNTYTGPGGFIDFSGVPGIEVGDVVAAENFFQLKSSGDVGVSVNQLIFNGSYIVGLQASRTYKELSYKATDQTNEVIVQGVTKAYYAVLINKERIDLFTSNIARVDTLLRNTRELFKNGFAESIDADRIQVTLNNLIVERDKFLNINELGLALLKFQMDYPANEPIEIAGTIKDVQKDINPEMFNPNMDYKSRPDYQLLEVNKKLQELNVRNRRAAYLPTLGAFLNYGYSTQSGNIGGLFKTNSGISDAGGVGPDKWYNYSNYGLSLNIPIFTGLQSRNKVQQEQIALQQINNSFVYLKSSIDFEIKQASLTYDNALKSLKTQEENMALADKVARVTKIKYEQGIGSNIEVIDAEDALRQAQTNYYSALYDVMIAKVDLEKSYGKLVPQIERN
jgi:outer membrane protein